MTDHVVLEVADLAAGRALYERALATVGCELAHDDHGLVGLGIRAGRRIDFFLASRGPAAGPVHVAFAAPDRAAVDVFHAAVPGAGGTDNGAPGLRPLSGQRSHAGFVLDPDGNDVEAVCHRAR